MNREIKFRAWFAEETKLLQVRELYQSEDSGVYAVQIIREDESDAQYWYTLAPSRFILMQFTGLKDKNGKEIYEGDIIAELNDSYKGPASVVKWNEEGAYFRVYRGETSSGYTLYGETARAEIIGNIYENPELLK